jgi:hypothetical protein
MVGFNHVREFCNSMLVMHEFHFEEIVFLKYVTYLYLSKFLMNFCEIHSLNFHLEDSGGAKWKFNFFPTL